MIKFEKFTSDNYSDLISWIDSEETLMQFAGPGYYFPLTPEQLDIALSDKSRIAFHIVSTETHVSIGHAEIYLLEDSAKIGRILIGDHTQRGKGLGQRIVHLLLEYIFFNLNRTKVELNVFDWNIGAIKCYEKVGFVKDSDKRLERKVNGQVWTAFTMSLDKSQYEQRQRNL